MGKGVKKQDKNSSYVAGNSEDPIYFGAQKVIDAELKLISKRKGKEITETNNTRGPRSFRRRNTFRQFFSGHHAGAGLQKLVE